MVDGEEVAVVLRNCLGGQSDLKGEELDVEEQGVTFTTADSSGLTNDRGGLTRKMSLSVHFTLNVWRSFKVFTIFNSTVQGSFSLYLKRILESGSN